MPQWRMRIFMKMHLFRGPVVGFLLTSDIDEIYMS
jgi:hypothetical protein